MTTSPHSGILFDFLLLSLLELSLFVLKDFDLTQEYFGIPDNSVVFQHWYMCC